MKKTYQCALFSESSLFEKSIQSIFSEEKEYTLTFYNSKNINTINSNNFDYLIIHYNNFSQISLNELKIIKSKVQHKKSFILTSLNEIKYGLTFLNLGFDGYMQENNASKEILEALNYFNLNLMQNNSFFYKDETKNEFMKSQLFTKKIKLTKQEKKILLYLKQGMNSKEIATELQCSDKTINVHRANMKEKLGFTNASQLLNFAYTHIDFSPPPLILSHKIFNLHITFSSFCIS